MCGISCMDLGRGSKTVPYDSTDCNVQYWFKVKVKCHFAVTGEERTAEQRPERTDLLL